MKALLLAAGLGTRLRPLTNKMPKCLVPINGRPLLDYWLEKIFLSGIEECLINTHYKSEAVDNYINKTKYREKIKLIYEPKLLGTAGSLKKNIKFFSNSNGLLIYADNFSTFNLNNFLADSLSMPKQCLISMLTFKCDDPSQAGIVKLNHKNIMLDFIEKPKYSKNRLANAGIFFMSKDFIKYISLMKKTVFDFSVDIIPFLKNKIYCIETNEIFYDIGTIKNYNHVNNLFKDNDLIK